jgi:hypothetical protein
MDNSNRIDSYEFICGLAILSHATLAEKAESIFKLYDFDNSQLLNQDEMVVLFRCVICALNALSERTHIPSIQEVEKLVINVLRKHDSDKNFEISLEEFKSIVTKDKAIVKCLRNFGLIISEDYRQDFGGGDDDIPECDSDLENEVNKQKTSRRSEKYELVRDGIEFRGGVKKDSNVFLEDLVLPRGEELLKDRNWYEDVKTSAPSAMGLDKNIGLGQPDVHLELEVAHGYRCFDTRNNVQYSPEGHLVYHTASIGIVLDKKFHSQKFFMEHGDDISCLCSHDTHVATGQLGRRPTIHVWDSRTISSKLAIQGLLKDGISQICFSNNGKKLAASSMDSNQTIAIYDIARLYGNKQMNKLEGLICTGKGPKEPILALKFDPGDSTIVIGCVKSIYFASFHNGELDLVKGTEWGKTPIQSIMCIDFQDSNTLAGSYSGDL